MRSTPKKIRTTQWRKQRRKEYLKRLIENNLIYKDMVWIEIEFCLAETMRVIGMAE